MSLQALNLILIALTLTADPMDTAAAFGRAHGLSDRYVAQITEFLAMQLAGRR